MRVLIQRCSKAECKVRGVTTGKIKEGLVLLVGFTTFDTKETVISMANKICSLRIFPDEDNVMNLSIMDVGGSILSVSQFTLYADTKKGNRPSYIKALDGAKAKLLYEYFNKVLSTKVKTETGIFKEDMEVSLTNMGPTTILLER